MSGQKPTACIAVGTDANFLTMAQSGNGSRLTLLRTINPERDARGRWPVGLPAGIGAGERLD